VEWWIDDAGIERTKDDEAEKGDRSRRRKMLYLISAEERRAEERRHDDDRPILIRTRNTTERDESDEAGSQSLSR
jgi:hypothetical protein